MAKAAAAKAAAADARKVQRRGARRAALVGLNTLAEEVGAARAQVDVKTASAEQVEHTIRVLEPRCPGPPLSTLLRALVEQWVANGGTLQAAGVLQASCGGPMGECVTGAIDAARS